MKIQPLLTRAFFLLLSDCGLHGSGEIVTREPEVEPLRRLAVCCGFDVTVTQGDKPALRISGDDNIVDELRIDQYGDLLSVDLPASVGGIYPTRPVRIEVVTPELREVSGSGGLELAIEPFTTPSLLVELSGGARASIDGLDARELALDGSGGSEFSVQGRATELQVELSGGGDLDALSCSAARVRVELSGGSVARVAAADSLTGAVSDRGEVFYRGKPEVDVELSGGSSATPE